jgi:hypothetical protein
VHPALTTATAEPGPTRLPSEPLNRLLAWATGEAPADASGKGRGIRSQRMTMASFFTEVLLDDARKGQRVSSR